MKRQIITLTILFTYLFIGCNKSDFLDKKPNTGIVQPVSLDDFQHLLDNSNVFNYAGGLAQISSDDYTVSYEDWQAEAEIDRNAYLWERDIYGGTQNIRDWNQLYQQIFYANNVLDGINKIDNGEQADYLKGWALFARAFANFDLVRNFCKPFDEQHARTELGIPVRLRGGIDEIEGRSSLEDTYDHILTDLMEAAALLPVDRPANNLNRPSRAAAYALLARVYLDMRKYQEAARYTDQALGIYDVLIDYNNVSSTSATPFNKFNEELLYNATQVLSYRFSVSTNSSPAKVNPVLIDLYETHDLRLQLFFGELNDGSFYKKVGYCGEGGYPFTGLATDELYLIKAECLARAGETHEAMAVLNKLLIHRYDKQIEFEPLKASTSSEALETILLERRKELVWRGGRWHDIKRLNMEGANITLSRELNGQQYRLEPNSSRYVFPIPDDEIALSGIQQNER